MNFVDFVNFESLDAFLAMGGHGLYVWLSYGVGLLVFLFAFVSPVIERKAILKDLLKLQRRKQRDAASSDKGSLSNGCLNKDSLDKQSPNDDSVNNSNSGIN